jgi:hypothetical protein
VPLTHTIRTRGRPKRLAGAPFAILVPFVVSCDKGEAGFFEHRQTRPLELTRLKQLVLLPAG